MQMKESELSCPGCEEALETYMQMIENDWSMGLEMVKFAK